MRSAPRTGDLSWTADGECCECERKRLSKNTHKQTRECADAEGIWVLAAHSAACGGRERGRRAERGRVRPVVAVVGSGGAGGEPDAVLIRVRSTNVQLPSHASCQVCVPSGGCASAVVRYPMNKHRPSLSSVDHQTCFHQELNYQGSSGQLLGCRCSPDRSRATCQYRCPDTTGHHWQQCPPDCRCHHMQLHCRTSHSL